MRTMVVLWFICAGAMSLTSTAAAPLPDMTAISDLVLPCGSDPCPLVNISGTVSQLMDEDTFILDDGTDSIPVYLDYLDEGVTTSPVSVNEAVTVEGMLDDDGPREFYASKLTSADGTTMQLQLADDDDDDDEGFDDDDDEGFEGFDDDDDEGFDDDDDEGYDDDDDD